jgi:hypothetical protein
MIETGDRGQRYQVEVFGWPQENKWNVFGFTSNPDGGAMRESAMVNPSITAMKIVDRFHKDFRMIFEKAP